MWFIYFPCIFLFYSGLHKNVFVFPEARTAGGGRRQSEKDLIEEKLN